MTLSTARVGEKAQQFLPAAIENRLASKANWGDNPNYLVLGMARRTGLPPYPEWRSKFIEDYYAMQMLGVPSTELTFRQVNLERGNLIIGTSQLEQAVNLIQLHGVTCLQSG